MPAGLRHAQRWLLINRHFTHWRRSPGILMEDSHSISARISWLHDEYVSFRSSSSPSKTSMSDIRLLASTVVERTQVAKHRPRPDCPERSFVATAQLRASPPATTFAFRGSSNERIARIHLLCDGLAQCFVCRANKLSYRLQSGV